ncbi:tyrosine-type recombinase/integrase [Halobellus sp. H-GB7]|uniref:tyrosine-type recombinase/integrase n=1 Tax=Halobellus sp. H-GB7 TaxID=3069756 RepID=UPI0027AFB8B1|nr:tyrosine-type recombinase/integrase [Halobellus sp. H-GB7]MDQ2055504.1 tyrosine-type recombinase/integrase [Halobellus sp. H-GB7]
MAKSKRQRYEQLREVINEKADSGEISEEERDSIIGFLDAKDPERTTVNDPDDGTKADGTLQSYAYSLKRISAEIELTDTTPDELNRLMGQFRRGEIEGVKDEGLAKGTVANYQKALRKFYEYHTDWGIDKEEITIYKQEPTSVDERDIFNREDIQALRDAVDHPRDAAFVDMLIYTGQRISCLLNLKNKDVDPQEGIFYIPEAPEMKGASGKRPLLYAEKSVRDWKRTHPCSDDPEAYFFTSKKEPGPNDNWEKGEKLDYSTLYVRLQRIKEMAGIDKPANPHNFRHSFVTIAKRDYGMDNDTIKHLIGHDLDSTVMETTYQHLTDDDIIQSAEEATGIREEEEESPLTPDICRNCDEPITTENAKACPSCGMLFTPDAQAAKDQIQDDIYESKGEAEGEEEEAVDEIKKHVKENIGEILRENPEIVEEALSESEN